MGDAEYYAAVQGCLDAARNGRFCAGAEDAAREIALRGASIKMLQDEVRSYQAKLQEAERRIAELSTGDPAP